MCVCVCVITHSKKKKGLYHIAASGHEMLLTALLSEPVSENGAFHAGVFDFPPGRNLATPHGREGVWGVERDGGWGGGARDGSFDVRSRGHQVEGGGGQGRGGFCRWSCCGKWPSIRTCIGLW